MKNISVQELHAKILAGEKIQIIDVRDDYEYETCNIGGELIPLDILEEHVGRIAQDCPVIIHCHLGGRSQEAVALLENNYHFTNIYNLEGGIDAWAREIDRSMPEY